MERFKEKVLTLTPAAALNLHSNMERFKEVINIFICNHLFNLHSNMERFKEFLHDFLPESDIKFTFQYGEI